MESSEFLKANKERLTEGQNEPGGSEPYKASDEPNDTYEANPGRSINLKESKFLPFYEPAKNQPNRMTFDMKSRKVVLILLIFVIFWGRYKTIGIVSRIRSSDSDDCDYKQLYSFNHVLPFF